MAGSEGICQDDDAGRLVAITILSSVCVLTVFGNTMVSQQRRTYFDKVGNLLQFVKT